MNRRHAGAPAMGALLAMSAATFAYVTTETLPIGLLPTISAALGVPESAVGLLVTCYGIVVVASSLPLTRVTRSIPRRPLLTGLLLVFGAAGVLCVATTDYWIVLSARVLTALSQALFWSIVIPTAAALFEPRRRGRAIALVFAGSSLAGVLGVPVGTWLGQQFGWRIAFLALSGVALVAGLAIATLLPTRPPAEEPDTPAATPDRAQYRGLLLVTAVVVTGIFATLTYVTPFLTDVAGIAATSVGPILLVRGLAGLLGVWLGGMLSDRRPQSGLTGSLTAQAVALSGLAVLGSNQVIAVIMIALSALSMSAFTTVLAGQVLQIAPGRTDLAAAGASTAVNVGITVGALAASLLFSEFGAQGTAIAGAFITSAALVIRLVARPTHRADQSTTSCAAGWSIGCTPGSV